MAYIQEPETALAELYLESPDDPEVLDAYSTALMDVGTIATSSDKPNELDAAAAKYAQAGELRQELKQSLETQAGRSWLAQQPRTVQERLRFVDGLIANAVKNRGDVELDRWQKQEQSTRGSRILGKGSRVHGCRASGPQWSSRPLLRMILDVRHDLAHAEYTLG